VDVIAKGARGPAFREKLLFTHRGLSGPAVLQASSYWKAGETIEVDFAPESEHLLGPLFEHGARRDNLSFRQVLQSALPQRLAAYLANVAAPHRWTNPALEATERSLHHFNIGNDRMPKEVYHAYEYAKKAAAVVNTRAGRLPGWTGDLIERVCGEVISGRLDQEFPLYVCGRPDQGRSRT